MIEESLDLSPKFADRCIDVVGFSHDDAPEDVVDIYALTNRSTTATASTQVVDLGFRPALVRVDDLDVFDEAGERGIRVDVVLVRDVQIDRPVALSFRQVRVEIVRVDIGAGVCFHRVDGVCVRFVPFLVQRFVSRGDGFCCGSIVRLDVVPLADDALGVQRVLDAVGGVTYVVADVDEGGVIICFVDERFPLGRDESLYRLVLLQAVFAAVLTTELGDVFRGLGETFEFVLELDELLDALGRRGLLKQVLQPCLELLDVVREREVYPTKLREECAGGRDPIVGFLSDAFVDGLVRDLTFRSNRRSRSCLASVRVSMSTVSRSSKDVDLNFVTWVNSSCAPSSVYVP